MKFFTLEIADAIERVVLKEVFIKDLIAVLLIHVAILVVYAVSNICSNLLPFSSLTPVLRTSSPN